MSVASCNKEEDTEHLDPQAGNHVVEATIHAEVSGAFTKALAIEVNYTDFEGNSEKVVVNGKFDGTNTVFDTSFRCEVTDKTKEAFVNFKTTLGDLDSYKNEMSPWAIKGEVLVRLDGIVREKLNCNEAESFAGIPILDPNGILITNWALAFHDQLKTLFGGDGSKNYVITARPDKVVCTIK